jgi:hypothetical protein
LVEGLFIGALSAIFEMRYPGIVIQAVGLTFGTMAALLLAYRSGLIKVTEKFKLGIVAATGGVMLLYLANFAMGFFGHSMGFINGHSGIGIVFSVCRGGDRRAEPGTRLRLHRIRRQRRCAEVHGVVRRVRAGGYPGLAVSGTAAAAVEAAVAELRL